MNNKFDDPYINQLSHDFDKLAEVYDSVWTTQIYDELILDHLKGNEENILEIGCGSGRLLSKLSQNASYVVGIDISKEMLKISNRNIDNNNVSLIHESVENINNVLDEHNFDTIVAERSIHHCLELSDITRKLSNKLRSNGRLIFFDLKSTRELSHKNAYSVFLKSLYKLSVLLYGLRNQSFIASAKGLISERKMFQTTAWKSHIAHEPDFATSKLNKILQKQGFSTHRKTVNAIFELIVANIE